MGQSLLLDLIKAFDEIETSYKISTDENAFFEGNIFHANNVEKITTEGQAIKRGEGGKVRAIKKKRAF